MRGHADAETLAALREELLPGRKAARVSAHLAACPRCAALQTQLAEVTTLLSRTAAPPMPEALTVRIHAALAAEAAARTTAAQAPHAAGAPVAVPATAGTAGYDGAPSANGRRADGRGLGGRGGEEPAHGTRWRGHDRSWLALRVAAVTAAVAVIAGGGYGVAQLLTGSPAAHGAASGPARRAPNAHVSGPPIPRMSGALGAPGAHSPGATGSSGRTMLPLVISSGTNYQQARLAAQASAVLAHLNPGKHAAPQPLPRIAASRQQARLFPELQACLIHISHGQRHELVDLARYQGRSALIVVRAGVNGASPQVLAIAPGCNATTAHILAQVPLRR